MEVPDFVRCRSNPLYAQLLGVKDIDIILAKKPLRFNGGFLSGTSASCNEDLVLTNDTDHRQLSSDKLLICRHELCPRLRIFVVDFAMLNALQLSVIA